MSISTTIKSIQDIMRKDTGTYGDAQRIEQLAWMFFLKILDDRDVEAELLDDDFVSPLPPELQWRAWAADDEGLTGDTLLKFIDNKLLPALKALPASQSTRATVIRSAFDDANNYMKNGTLMRQVVNKINEIDFNNSKDRHLLGDVYEQILRDLQSAGNAGEFYTPRAVTQFMVQQTAPQLGERILDPACGTGGFLTAIIDYIRDETGQVNKPAHEEKLQASIHGVEKKHLPHILYSREGGILGVGCRVPPNVQLCLGQRMMLIRPPSNIDPTYLELVLNSPHITSIAKGKTTGAAAPRVNVATVKAYPIPVPGQTEQKRIVSKVSALLSQCDELSERLRCSQSTTDALLTALIHQILIPSP